MKVTTTSLDTLKDPNATLVFQKIPKKTSFALPAEPPLYECELVKKGKLTKNKRYFMFYPTKCLFFQVNFTFPFIFPLFSYSSSFFHLKIGQIAETIEGSVFL